MASATVTDLAARALRRIGVAIVPASANPGSADIATSVAIVSKALRDLGTNPVAEPDMAPDTSTISVTELAARALRGIGINLVSESSESAPAPPSRTPDYLAQNALKLLGINPVEQANAPPLDTEAFTQQQIGAMALTQLGVYAPDETPDANDAETAATFVVAVHNHLVSLNAVRWLETAIPTQVSALYTQAAAAQMGPVFGKPLDTQTYVQVIAAIKQIALGNQYAQSFALDHIAMVHSELVGLNLASWGEATIPDALSETYSKLAAIRMAPAFGQPIDVTAFNGQPLDQAYDTAMATVRMFTLSGAAGQALAEARVTSVHEDLAGKNLVAWTVTTIPARAAESYVMLAMGALAPMVKATVPPEQLVAAEATIRAMALSGAYAMTIGTNVLTNIHDALVAASIVPWAITAIPAAVSDSYSALVSSSLAPAYGKVADLQRAKLANDQIVNVVLVMGSQALAEQIFREIHAEWRDRDMTRWELFDIPRSAEESYIAATGIRLAPQFPGAKSPDNIDDAESRLYRVITLESAGEPVRADYF